MYLEVHENKPYVYQIYTVQNQTYNFPVIGLWVKKIVGWISY